MNQPQRTLDVESREVEKPGNAAEIGCHDFIRPLRETHANHRCAGETLVIFPDGDRIAGEQLMLTQNDVGRDVLCSIDCSIDADNRFRDQPVLAKKPGDVLRDIMVLAHAQGVKPLTIFAH